MKLKLLNIPYTRWFIIVSWPTLGFISVFFLHNELLAPCKIVYLFFWAFISGTFFWNNLPLFSLWVDNSLGLLGRLPFPATGCPLYPPSTLCKNMLSMTQLPNFRVMNEILVYSNCTVGSHPPRIKCQFYTTLRSCLYHSSHPLSAFYLVSSFHTTYPEIRLPRWLSGKESASQCRNCRKCKFNPWVGKIFWRGEWQPTLVFLLG